MFFQPLLAENGQDFISAIENIKNLYYPQELYKNAIPQDKDESLKELKAFSRTVHPGKSWDDLDLSERANVLSKWIDHHVKEITSKPNYVFDDPDNNVSLPLTEYYHRYFLKREYNYPFTEAFDLSDFLFSLSPDNEKGDFTLPTNYSANLGDFHHFGNVFAAVTRLILYFSDFKNIERLIDAAFEPQRAELIAQQLSYDFKKTPPHITYKQDMGRIFRLLVAAFYHDVGKTVVHHRHALEGSILIAFQSRNLLKALYNIMKSSKHLFDELPDTFALDRDDANLVEDLVHYHDLFGTIGTGETGYIRLVEPIDSFVRFSRKYTFLQKPHGNRSQRKNEIKRLNMWSMRCLFDLWVLNVADIMVSRPGVLDEEFLGLDTSLSKFDNQLLVKEKRKKPDDDKSRSAKPIIWAIDTEAERVIEKFFSDTHGANLCHDLMFSFDLIDLHANKIHADDTRNLFASAREYASRHAIERIRRLARASLMDVIYKSHEEMTFKPGKFKDLVDGMNEGIFEQNSPWLMRTIIKRFIHSTGDASRFSERLAWIGHMDYALPFFTVIARVFLNDIQELYTRNSNAPDMNLYGPVSEHLKSDGSSHAITFMETYISVMLQIVIHILDRDVQLNAVRNIEFATAKDRLKEEKVRRILGLEGPYRQQRAIDLVLESIFIW